MWCERRDRDFSKMLTESVSDPRRANWLTISSMSEDLSWPEETNITRPNWEVSYERFCIFSTDGFLPVDTGNTF